MYSVQSPHSSNLTNGLVRLIRASNVWSLPMIWVSMNLYDIPEANWVSILILVAHRGLHYNNNTSAPRRRPTALCKEMVVRYAVFHAHAYLRISETMQSRVRYVNGTIMRRGYRTRHRYTTPPSNDTISFIPRSKLKWCTTDRFVKIGNCWRRCSTHGEWWCFRSCGSWGRSCSS